MTTHDCDNCTGVDPATCLFARPADTFVPWEETKRKMQVLQAAERTARISAGLNERLADGDTREAHSHPAGDGCTPRCVVPSDHDTAQCGCADDTRDRVVYGTGQNGKGSVLDADELTRLFDGDTREAHAEGEHAFCGRGCEWVQRNDPADDTRDQIAAAMRQAVSDDPDNMSHGEEIVICDLTDAAMSVVGPKLEALRAELSSSKAAHRAVWDKHQKRGQWIFDLQGENARLRAGAKTSAGHVRTLYEEIARLRAELEHRKEDGWCWDGSDYT